MQVAGEHLAVAHPSILKGVGFQGAWVRPDRLRSTVVGAEGAGALVWTDRLPSTVVGADGAHDVDGGGPKTCSTVRSLWGFPKSRLGPW